MEKIYGGFKKNETEYSYGSVEADFDTIRAEIEVDNIEEGLDFMVNYFGKPIAIAPGYSWQYEDAKTHARREQLKGFVGQVEKVVENVEKVEEEMVVCSCGHYCKKSLVMSTSTGSSCPKCHDRMSE